MKDDKTELNLQELEDATSSTTTFEDAANSDISQNGVTELTQTNVVTFANKVESIAIEKSHIRKIRDLCKAAEEKNTLSRADICLGISSLFAGTFLSAIISSIPLNLKFNSILSYIVSPTIAVSCFVAYLFLRNNESASVKALSEHILEFLPEEDGNDEGEL